MDFNYLVKITFQSWLFDVYIVIVHGSGLLVSGKMFKSLDLPLIVEFMLMFYKDKPIDWLLDHIMWVKVCNPEKDVVRTNDISQMCKFINSFCAHLIKVLCVFF